MHTLFLENVIYFFKKKLSNYTNIMQKSALSVPPLYPLVFNEEWIEACGDSLMLYHVCQAITRHKLWQEIKEHYDPTFQLDDTFIELLDNADVASDNHSDGSFSNSLMVARSIADRGFQAMLDEARQRKHNK